MKYMPNLIRILFLALFLFLLANGKVMLWFALFAVSLLAAFIFGRVYCGYICPMNTVMIPAEWLSKKLQLQKTTMPRMLKNGYFSWITLVISIAVMLMAKSLLHVDLPVLPFWMVISILVTLRFGPDIFHNLVCPFGALQRTFGRFAKRSKKVDKDSCIGCKLCEKACPANAIVVNPKDKKAVINTALCHQCTNCLQVCPKSAIHYGKHI